MPESPRAFFERYIEALNRQDWTALEQFFHADYVDESPQSGERIRGFANMKAMLTNYPGGEQFVDAISDVEIIGADEQWAVTPMLSVVRVEGTADVYTGVARTRYPDGSTWHVVMLVRLRDGKIWRTTTYYGPEFPAPEWRSQWVERMDPATAP
jgi:ketosteroid isomerase-like protein